MIGSTSTSNDNQADTIRLPGNLVVKRPITKPCHHLYNRLPSKPNLFSFDS
jgi:hypothetical protein